ncbi:hypothetical protein [Sinorhizobium meliloti]|uniref:hypothetical protein n=1 Tax=Rhizobium meliloti TaxID=382 RepID=UPI000517CF0C|nr:hypothetical protein [Sinorhizobium meliloti]
MTKLSRSETIAIFGLGLALVSIVLVAWAPPPARLEDNVSAFWEDTAPQWLMAIFSVLSTLISALAVLMVSDTLRETRKTTGFAEQSAGAAIQASKEAQESNRIADRASVLENRPWVEIRDFSIDNVNILNDLHPHIMSRNGLAISGRYVLRNLGKTPAINVHSMQVYALREDIHSMGGRIERGLERLDRKEPMHSLGILGPGSEDAVRFSWVVPVNEPPRMGAGYLKHDLQIAIAPLVSYGSNLQDGAFHTAQAFALHLDAGPGMHRFAPDFEDIKANGMPKNLVAVRLPTSLMG